MNEAHFEDRFVVVDNTEIKYIRHGRIRHVGTPEILVTYGVQEKDLVYVSAADILTLKPGPLVPPNYDSRSWYSPDSTTFSEMRSLMVSVAKGKGIEIGPGPHALQFPLQCEVSYLDSYTIEQQHERTWFGYAESSIMPTDIKGSWEDLALMEKDSLDFIAASHVIEHLRNPIKGLVTAFNCLKEGGFLFLVVPDKRYMFDCHRELTTLDHMINDWTNPCDLRDFEHYQDFYQNAAGDPNWIQRAHAEHDAGMDIHFHTFIPSSFCSLLLYLKDNFVLNYKSLWWQPKIESDNLCQEFYIAIRK
jgi:SAM-dependent methyltransferase